MISNHIAIGEYPVLAWRPQYAPNIFENYRQQNQEKI